MRITKNTGHSFEELCERYYSQEQGGQIVFDTRLPRPHKKTGKIPNFPNWAFSPSYKMMRDTEGNKKYLASTNHLISMADPTKNQIDPLVAAGFKLVEDDESPTATYLSELHYHADHVVDNEAPV